MHVSEMFSFRKCSGSESFWASRIRIHNYLYPDPSINEPKNCYLNLNVPSKQEDLEKKTFVVGILKATEQDPDPDPLSSVRIQGPGSESKCHGSGTLVSGKDGVVSRPYRPTAVPL